MKKYFVLANLLFFSLLSFGQDGMRFEQTVWNEVLAKAKKENKMVFVDIFTTWCGPCKTMSARVFPDPTVGEKYNKLFVNFKIDAEKGEGIDLASRYKVEAYPTYLFVSPDGELVYRSVGAMPPDKFIAEGEKAANFFKDYKPMAVFENEYKAGKREKAFLEQYISKRTSLGLDNSELLEEYIAQVAENERNSPKTLKLIAENVSKMDSKAFDLLATNWGKMTEIYPVEAEREETKEKVMKVCFEVYRNASQNQNVADLEKFLATLKKMSLADADLGKDWDQTEMGFHLDYHFAGKNLPKYAEIGKKYVSQFLLSMTETELKNKDKAESDKFYTEYRAGKYQQLDSAANPEQFAMIIEYIKKGIYSQGIAKNLNQMAWNFYENLEEKADLQAAGKWAERAVQLDYQSSYIDTYAHLLFKLGEKTKAIEWQEKAIAYEKAKGGDTSTLEESLAEMKK